MPQQQLTEDNHEWVIKWDCDKEYICIETSVISLMFIEIKLSCILLLRGKYNY